MAVALCHVTLPGGVTELFGVSPTTAVGLNGSIVFTPRINDVVSEGQALGVPKRIDTQVRDGQWVDSNGDPGVWLVRPDSTDRTFVYDARVMLDYRNGPGGENHIADFHIAVPAADNAVLTDILAVPGPPSTFITKGDPGPAPSLTQGTVTTLPAGSSATASIASGTGTPSDPYVWDVGLPQGQTGQDGAPGGSDSGTAGWLTTPASLTNAALGNRFMPEMYGTCPGDDTDVTAFVNAAIAAAQAQAGEVTLTSGKRYTCLGAITPTYTGTNPTQKPVRITSPGAPSSNGYWAAAALNGGATLDLRYDGTDGLHPAKVDTRGAGVIEIDHLNIISGGTDDYPIFQTTGTTTHIHHNYIQGNLAKTGLGCKQDAIFFGGTSATLGAGADAPFQGYGSTVHDNYFTHIRRGFVGRSYCNSVPIERNTFSSTCGNDGTGTGNYGGAIEFQGNPTAGFTVGNSTRANTIEVVNYKYAVALVWATNSSIGPDGYWDPGSAYTAGVYVDPSATWNRVTDGYHNQTYPLVADSGLSTTVHTGAQSRSSFYASPQIYRNHAVTVDRYGNGPPVMAPSGDQAWMASRAGALGTPSYPYVSLVSSTANQVTDLVTTTGSRIVTSATAGWTREDQYMPIAAAGLPASTVIARYISPTSVELTAAATASATVPAQFGRLTGGTNTEQVAFARTHIWSKGSLGTVSILAAAGAGATASGSGTDTAWTLTLNTGTSPAAGDQVVAGAGMPWVSVPKYSLTPKNASAATAMMTNGVSLHNTTANVYLMVNTALPASTTLIFDLVAVG